MVKNLPTNAGDPGSIAGLGISPGEQSGNPLQCFCLGNPNDRGTWQATIDAVAKDSDPTIKQQFYIQIITQVILKFQFTTVR